MSKSEGMSEHWAVPPRYQLIKVIGSGSYGKVCHAYDRVMKRNVAIKKIKRIFEDLIDCKRLLREIAILARLNAPDTVVKMYDVCVPDDPRNFTELYLVLELADSDFKKLIKLPEFLTENHVITLLFNTLCGLKYIHSAGILHRDLKPANCLVNRDCSVKICDFGLSRPVDEEGQEQKLTQIGEVTAGRNKNSRLTGHVVTRWYRAPELILLQESYSAQIDVWSLGCIFAELLGMIKDNFPNSRDRSPIFQGSTCYPLSPHKEPEITYDYYYGRHSRDQLYVIFNILGTPNERFLERLDKEDAQRYVQCFGEKEGIDLADLPRFQASSPATIDLLRRMLALDASERISVDDALMHPVFKDVFVESKIRVAEEKIDLDFEHVQDLGEPQLRYYFLREIQRFNPEMHIPESIEQKAMAPPIPTPARHY